MSQPELLRAVVEVLEAAGAPYMVTGSTASSLQGPPRSTHDIDLVVSLSPGAIQALLDAFPPPSFFLTRPMIEDAIKQRSMFNLLAIDEGEKVDFWMLTDEPFDQSRFARRYKAKAAGQEFYVSSPEDTILAKLRWSELSGGSEKQFRDALSVYEVQYDSLDQSYMEQWVERLEMARIWNRLKSEARPF